MSARISSFEDFWPFYLSQHGNAANRRLHVAGTIAALGVVVAALVLGKPWCAAAAPVAGYGPAWVGHFFFEHNRPATFTYPWWSLRADFRMFFRLIFRRPLLP